MSRDPAYIRMVATSPDELRKIARILRQPDDHVVLSRSMKVLLDIVAVGVGFLPVVVLLVVVFFGGVDLDRRGDK